MAKKISKKLAVARAKIEKEKTYPLLEAIKLAKQVSYTKFKGSLDLTFTTNLDVRKAEQQLRGAIALPHGTGKTIRILATTDNDDANLKKAGADIVADKEQLLKILQSKKFNFDVIVASPKMMPILGRFGKDLGPKGLMPNPKTGTVTTDLVKAITEIKKGKANYRTDKNGVVHTVVGKVDMDDAKILENAKVVIDTIKRLKPASFKGTYIRNLTISPTMGPSVKIEMS